MQQTRQHILEILRSRSEATVDELVEALEPRIGRITPVTVRHHLDVLRGEQLIETRVAPRKCAPGRPQHVYALTDKALEYFPSNYQTLAASLLDQIKASLPPKQVNVIIEGVADQMAGSVRLAHLPMMQRLDQVVNYLNGQGYDAHWTKHEQGYVLHTSNCPYHKVVAEHEELCIMDMRLIAGLVGVVPRRLSRVADKDESCTYLIPERNAVNSPHPPTPSPVGEGVGESD